MRELVTGAKGRVGSRLVPRLLKRGDSVRILRRKEADQGPFKQWGAETVVGVDAIIHLAAFFRGATEVQARATNLDGTLALQSLSISALTLSTDAATADRPGRRMNRSRHLIGFIRSANWQRSEP